MNNKKKLLERMGSIGEMPINENINEEVPGGDLVNDLQNLFYKHGYFFKPTDPATPIVFKKIDENQGEFNELMEVLSQQWNQISLPF